MYTTCSIMQVCVCELQDAGRPACKNISPLSTPLPLAALSHSEHACMHVQAKRKAGGHSGRAKHPSDQKRLLT